jgi:hypothetical protein
MIVLALKPHQEDVDDIDDFEWRMCVSFRKLSSVITRAFTYPIRRCSDSIEDFDCDWGFRYIISADAFQGSFQVEVLSMHQ